jgi:RNA polymerase sigma factor (sigma-70 family)
MTADPMEELLQQLSDGDIDAAEQVFRTFEPYLRKVVRQRLPRSLRARFDSVDIVQSIWADLFRGFRDAGWRFADREHLRAFLVKATQRRLIDRCRQHAAAVERERSRQEAFLKRLPPPPEPGPSEVAEENDLWEHLLARCPPAHRELLRLRRQGVPIADIAARSGLHENSVRRILRTIARQMVRHQETLARPSHHES